MIQAAARAISRPVFLREFCANFAKNIDIFHGTRKTIRLTQKKWNNRQYGRERFQPRTFLGKTMEKHQLFIFCSLKTTFILIFSKICFQKTDWLCVQYHQWKKTTEAKKVSNFYVATFVWLNKSFEILSPKLGLSARNSWDLCEKSFTPQLRLLISLFYFTKCPQNFMSKWRNFHFFCKILIFKAQIENRLSLWCGLKEKDVLLITDMCNHEISWNRLMHHSD